MKKIVIVVIVLLVILGLFWAWSHYSMHRSSTAGTAIINAPLQNTQPSRVGN